MAVTNINFTRNNQTGKFEAALAGQSCTFRIDFTHTEWVEAYVCHEDMLPRHIYVNAAQTHRFSADCSTDETIKIVCYSEPVGGVVMEPSTGASQSFVQQVTDIRSDLDAIIGAADTTDDIDTLNEIKAFLAEIKNSKTLNGVISDAQPEEMTENDVQDIRNLIQ